jgi:hypothetical protein
MARPPFSLPDEEARALVKQVADLNARAPLNPRDHRQFVREFIGAIHRVTGKTFSPAIYRRLLAAYAPDRKPSTATLALEKERFVKEQGTAPAHLDTSAELAAPGTTLRSELRQLLEDFAQRPALAASSTADSYLHAQCDFLQQRLSHSEKQLAEAKAAVYELDARRQVLEAQGLQAREELESLRASGAAMQDQLAGLARAVDDARQFALLAIDEARGETRAWKERCIAAEAQYKEQVSLTETFRRLAYRQGADIPPALERKTT